MFVKRKIIKKNNTFRSEALSKLLFFVPAGILTIGFVLFPLFSNIYLSFTQWGGFKQPRWVWLSNYLIMFRDEIFWKSLINNVVVMGMGLGIMLPVSLFIAIILNRGIPGRQLFRAVIFIPVIIPMIIVSILWTRIYDGQSGILNMILRSIKLDFLAKNWLADPNTALFSLIVVWMWRQVGYFVVLLVAGLQNIPKSLKESARIDGVSEFKIDLLISIPLIKPILVVVSFWIILWSFKIFTLVYVMTMGGPYYHTEVLNTYMYRIAFQNYRLGMGSTIATFVLMCMVILGMLRRLFSTEVEY